MTKKLAILLINLYQRTVSPIFAALGTQCRYHPSCSCYAAGSIEEWGISKGTWLSLKRILKCNPLFPGGPDPVIKKEGKR